MMKSHNNRTNRVLGATVMLAALGFGAAPALGGDLTITLEGDCPGPLRVTWQGADADQWAVLCFSPAEGYFVLPSGPCQGTIVGLDIGRVWISRPFHSGAEGRGEISGRARRAACGWFTQMIVADGLPCTASNVVQLP